MSIYDYDITNATANLTPPHKRKPTTLAFLSIFNWMLQKLHYLFFYSYADGDAAGDWISGVTYVFESKTRYNNAIYECINGTGVTSAINPATDTTNWIKVQDSFIGCRERVKYTGAKISIEFALNRYFKLVTTLPFLGANHTTQIYITNNASSSNNFWLSNGGLNARTSYLSNGSNQRYFLGNAYTPASYNFTIYVPIALFNSLGTTTANREGVIRSVADKQVQCGKIYNIITY